ncbi:MAG: hypothetical protein RJA98_1009 [Pseudomonadota bacterium]
MFTAVLAVALVSVSLLVPLRHERTAQQREREAQLLWVGAQYRQAIGSYHAASPGSIQQFPRTLQDLVEDKRFPTPRRHLRRLYADPITGQPDWTLVLEQGAIVGVASRSLREPLKQANFSSKDGGFTGMRSYAEWRFLDHAVDPNAAAAAAGSASAATGNIPTPSTPLPEGPTPERRSECLRQMSQALNQCALESDVAGCRTRARLAMQACLR